MSQKKRKSADRGGFIQPTKRAANVAFSVVRDLQPDMLEKKGLPVEPVDDGEIDAEGYLDEQEARVRAFIVGLYPRTTREGMLYLAIVSVIATVVLLVLSAICFDWGAFQQVPAIVACGVVPGLLLSCALARFMVSGEVGKQRVDKMTGEKTPAPDRFGVVSFVIVLIIALCMCLYGVFAEVGSFGGDAFVAALSREATMCVVVAELVQLAVVSPLLNTNFSGLCALLRLRPPVAPRS